ncbi:MULTISPECIES: nitrate/sulfonate/bicarbonate ABC transporter ATP-binding protein [Arthrobacter]|uniref:Nitrate/sulfonate/bicarbonate ABC transporter ATP-binding protein n=2 Tax=Arthrobacter TaxID=1663 RepID=A0ABU9KG18_9MICC|nr:nitrate/sulfonate/bicarbonate ABC transporter ATP-binding protein [Arthrobacter sp. YJM1]MDP5225732.1 nitrate/sulfonate/bicarbonate ABC transporter ATP-binding protein [Arthrobacter sp. YJM1]
MNNTTLIAVDDVTKVFATDGGEKTVLDGISLTINHGEIVALLGRSGSGKSTLLRCIAGLIGPSTGTVSYKGTPLNGSNPGTALVFQSFALLPWLTVLENVELGLEAKGIKPAERRERALKAIDVIGLDGFESAYPKELSGGMRQRVGFARALVVEPDVLLMDEPFSALDVLTSENLRSELVRMWSEGTMPTQTALIVTHNIEEAIQLADRILVLDSNPGRIKAELTVELPKPRDRRSPEFEDLVDEVYGILTGQQAEPRRAAVNGGGPDAAAAAQGLETPLPTASTGSLGGIVELLAAHGGSEGLAEIADELRYEIDDLLPVVDAAQLLKLVRTQDGALRITEQGRRYAGADLLRAKEQFATLAVEAAPLVRHIVKELRRSDSGAIRADGVLSDLRALYGDQEAQQQLDTAVDWGRYGELFEYDADSGRLLLPTHPDATAAAAGQTVDA